MQLVDEAGNVVYEDFTTATCGTGCWGGYNFHIDVRLRGNSGHAEGVLELGRER